MSDEIDVEALQSLAAAVVRQAFWDLRGPDAYGAKQFLLHDLWDPECIWGGLLQLNRERVVAGVLAELTRPAIAA